MRGQCLSSRNNCMTKTHPLVSFQEKIKIVPSEEKQTLHERMCFIADNVVRYNMSDVAVHDKRILSKMRAGETRLWIVNEFGSQFPPMYSKLGDWKKQELHEAPLCAVSVTLAKQLQNNVLSKRLKESSELYLVCKGDDAYGGTVAAISLADIVHLVYGGDADHLV